MEVEVDPNQPGTTTFSPAFHLWSNQLSKVGHIWKMMDVRVSQISGWRKKNRLEQKNPGSPAGY